MQLNCSVVVVMDHREVKRIIAPRNVVQEMEVLSKQTSTLGFG